MRVPGGLLAPHAAAAQPGTRPLDPLAYTLTVLACAAVAARRVIPLPVLAVVIGALVVFAVRDYPGGPLLIAVMVALYSAGTAVERPTALVLGAGVTIVVAARAWLTTAEGGRVSAYTWAAPGWALASLAWGAAVRSRRQLLEPSRLRAELAEQTREAEARRRADQERLRIARDLHDVIGHSFAAVNVQARMAAAVLDSDRDRARHALTAIETISRTALTEIRQALGQLRASGQPGGAVPAGTLATQVAVVLEPLRQAGIRVDAQVELGEAPLPGAAAEAVYRVVQESLTNVLRHSQPAAVRLAVARDGEAVTVEVVNDGTRPAADPAVSGGGPGGHGIAGMTERVAALGGVLTAAPAGDGFRVTARVPARAGDP
ncbi:MAG: sensor histidine kinase [Gemmatimonadota bacterium]